jgi:hypothetical protein
MVPADLGHLPRIHRRRQPAGDDVEDDADRRDQQAHEHERDAEARPWIAHQAQEVPARPRGAEDGPADRRQVEDGGDPDQRARRARHLPVVRALCTPSTNTVVTAGERHGILLMA